MRDLALLTIFINHQFYVSYSSSQYGTGVLQLVCSPRLYCEWQLCPNIHFLHECPIQCEIYMNVQSKVKVTSSAFSYFIIFFHLYSGKCKFYGNDFWYIELIGLFYVLNRGPPIYLSSFWLFRRSLFRWSLIYYKYNWLFIFLSLLYIASNVGKDTRLLLCHCRSKG